MQKELLTLFLRLKVPVGGSPTVDPAHVSILNKEIATLGYSFGPDVLAAVMALSARGFTDFRKTTLDLIAEVVGANVKHRQLFTKFPHSTPNQQEYLLSRVLGYLQHEFDLAPANATLLSCGHAIDGRLFDLSEFGACPICQRQVPELLGNRSPPPNIPFASLTPLRMIELADDAFLAEKGNALLARNGSLSDAEKAFLGAIPSRITLQLPERLFKETLPIAYQRFGPEALAGHLSGATDVLRVMAYCSDPKADLSLASPVKLKLSTRHKRAALVMLESIGNLEEDFMRHAEAWKRFARHAHVGTTKFRSKYPNATRAFDRLINEEGAIRTFGRRVEPLLRGGAVGELSLVLVERPGEFMRRIDAMLRNIRSGDPKNGGRVQFFENLGKVLPKATTKVLFEIRKYLEHRDQAVGQRVFLPKGNSNKAQVVKDRRKSIRDEDILRTLGMIEAELSRRFSDLEAMGSVYIDTRLRSVVMPYNQRGNSATSVPMAKGSRFPIGEKAEVLRLFVHWVGQDVDLSGVILSDTFDTVDHIAFTNLRGSGAVHSGDIQYAPEPEGASEFIDFDIDTVRKKHRGRYLAISVISYSGETFDTFPCFAGFMERDGLKSGQVFEPQSVALKFELTGKTKSYMPLFFDLETREVIWTDIASGGGRYGAVVGQEEKFQALARMVADLPHTKPTAYDVLAAHAKVRGRIVERREDADAVYDRVGIDIEAVAALMG